MLIDTRDERPPAPDPISIDWVLCGWLALTLALFVGASEVPALLGPVLAFLGLLTTGKVLLHIVGGDWRGLAEWRQ